MRCAVAAYLWGIYVALALVAARSKQAVVPDPHTNLVALGPCRVVASPKPSPYILNGVILNSGGVKFCQVHQTSSSMCCHTGIHRAAFWTLAGKPLVTKSTA